MKFFVAFAALVVLAAATPMTKPVVSVDSELQAILDAINHPSTDPATAALLMDMFYELLGVEKPDISPALVEELEVQTPDISPALVDFGTPKPSSPLVQIIVNVPQSNSPAPGPVPVSGLGPIPRPVPGPVLSPRSV